MLDSLSNWAHDQFLVRLRQFPADSHQAIGFDDELEVGEGGVNPVWRLEEDDQPRLASDRGKPLFAGFRPRWWEPNERKFSPGESSGAERRHDGTRSRDAFDPYA